LSTERGKFETSSTVDNVEPTFANPKRESRESLAKDPILLEMSPGFNFNNFFFGLKCPKS
jgi:hypothetical protein